MRTYRSVADPAGLLPAERDPVTGRRVARRDDKRRRRHRSRRPRRPWLVGGAVAVAIVVVAAGVAALVGGDDSSSSKDRARTRGTSSSGTPSAAGSADDVVAGAISADYRGGHVVTETCVDPGGGSCVPPKIDWTPLIVRCTSAGCTATIFNTTIALDNRPVSYATSFAYEDPACGTAPVTGSLRGVGHVTEHGLERPSRIVGRLRVDATPHRVPGIDCQGGVREFAYDATKG